MKSRYRMEFDRVRGDAALVAERVAEADARSGSAPACTPLVRRVERRSSTRSTTLRRRSPEGSQSAAQAPDVVEGLSAWRVAAPRDRTLEAGGSTPSLLLRNPSAAHGRGSQRSSSRFTRARTYQTLADDVRQPVGRVASPAAAEGAALPADPRSVERTWKTPGVVRRRVAAPRAAQRLIRAVERRSATDGLPATAFDKLGVTAVIGSGRFAVPTGEASAARSRRFDSRRLDSAGCPGEGCAHWR